VLHWLSGGRGLEEAQVTDNGGRSAKSRSQRNGETGGGLFRVKWRGWACSDGATAWFFAAVNAETHPTANTSRHAEPRSSAQYLSLKYFFVCRSLPRLRIPSSYLHSPRASTAVL
jgi:hypothetical protein